MVSRRQLLAGGGLLLATLPYRRVLAAGQVEIVMRSDPDGAMVGFDPIGLLIAPGTTVRWVVEANVHTATAYHPANDRHQPRIPEQARPWDSDYLVEPGQSFTVRLEVPGTYDYFCAPHEMAGMVGRIIVGHSGGPGSLPFDRPGSEAWQPVPAMAQAAFPSVRRIMAERVVPLAGVPRS